MNTKRSIWRDPKTCCPSGAERFTVRFTEQGMSCLLGLHNNRTVCPVLGFFPKLGETYEVWALTAWDASAHSKGGYLVAPLRRL